MRFLYYYIRSMRLYYGFVTGSTTLFGVVIAHEMYGVRWGWTDVLVLTIGFLAWGVNQIFNDAGGIREDAVNAPHRPMVTGQLPERPALLLSGALMLVFAAVSFFLTPCTFVPIAAGVVFNLFYTFSKSIPVLGCLVYGCSISMCLLFGWIGALGRFPSDPSPIVMLFCLLVLPAHVLMCHNSNFKDIEGDRAAGKKTLQILFRPGLSIWLSGILSVAYDAFLFYLILSAAGPAASFAVFFFLLMLTGWNLLNLAQKKYHAATLSCCQLCVAQVLSLMVCFSLWWLILAGVSFLLIQLIFKWYPDEKE